MNSFSDIDRLTRYCKRSPDTSVYMDSLRIVSKSKEFMTFLANSAEELMTSCHGKVSKFANVSSRLRVFITKLAHSDRLVRLPSNCPRAQGHCEGWPTGGGRNKYLFLSSQLWLSVLDAVQPTKEKSNWKKKNDKSST